MGKPRDLANVVATGNILADGAVAPAELTGVTSTAAEINILDGVTATAAELNLLDGVTATTAELNHVDGVTSNVQTQMDTKAPVADPTFTGTVTGPTINASTALQIGGVAVTATAAELNKMDGVTVSASDINSVTAKAPAASPTFTGDVTLPESIIHTGDTDTKLQFNDNDSFRIITGDEERFKANNGEVIINDNSVDMDFRVESNGNANMLFVDGGNDRVGIGTSNPVAQFAVGGAGRRIEIAGTDGVIRGFDRSASWANIGFEAAGYTFGVSGSERMSIDANGDASFAEELIAKSYNETYVSLSAAATVDINNETGNVFALTTNQNTTFTFSNPPASGTAYGFTLKLTSGGSHTITYPNSVDFAGGTAPDAPASGETDVLVFITVDGGTNWYGALAIDAAG
tara:strand:- start:1002 stop:2210 length:1209 start_codon:yes stop_codon:yes gene_type:complete